MSLLRPPLSFPAMMDRTLVAPITTRLVEMSKPVLRLAILPEPAQEIWVSVPNMHSQRTQLSGPRLPLTAKLACLCSRKLEMVSHCCLLVYFIIHCMIGKVWWVRCSKIELGQMIPRFVYTLGTSSNKLNEIGIFSPLNWEACIRIKSQRIQMETVLLYA